VGWTCGTHEGGERCLQGFGWETQREKRQLEDVGIGGRLDLKETGFDGEKWILIAQDSDWRRSFVITVMNFQVPEESRLLFDKMSDYHLFEEYPAPWSK
jgi:hypothetical protein